MDLHVLEFKLVPNLPNDLLFLRQDLRRQVCWWQQSPKPEHFYLDCQDLFS